MCTDEEDDEGQIDSYTGKTHEDHISNLRSHMKRVQFKGNIQGSLENIMNKKQVYQDDRRTETANLYEFPEDYNDTEVRSEMLENLLISINLKENLKFVTDMAFESIDADGSGGLD